MTAPDTAWASDFTFIRTQEGGMSLAVVIDLFSRQVVVSTPRNSMPAKIIGLRLILITELGGR